MVEPGKHPKVTKPKDDLDSLLKAVSIGAGYQGFIEIVGFFEWCLCYFFKKEIKIFLKQYILRKNMVIPNTQVAP